MSPKKKGRSSGHESRRKFTEDERREAEKKHAPAPVEREHFQEVIRRLVTVPPTKKGRA